MKKIRAAVVGYGNIGKYVVQALNESPDFEIAGIVRRNSAEIPSELSSYRVVSSLSELKEVEVALLCTPSRKAEEYAIQALELGINTVDSFDIHTEIVACRERLEKVAVAHNKVAILSAGWDPGTDSMVRSILKMCSPKGITYTNFGPGMSMGHTVAVKNIEGVKAALSMTIPLGTSVHRRMVYVELLPGHTLEKVAAKIKADPYFIHDETHVQEVDSVQDLLDMGHATLIERKGVSSGIHNQNYEFRMKINNPALTAQIMVSSARAGLKQKPGAYTLIEIPLIDFLYGDRNDLIRELV